jgi:hypothetical protein
MDRRVTNLMLLNWALAFLSNMLVVLAMIMLLLT